MLSPQKNKGNDDVILGRLGQCDPSWDYGGTAMAYCSIMGWGLLFERRTSKVQYDAALGRCGSVSDVLTVLMGSLG